MANSLPDDLPGEEAKQAWKREAREALKKATAAAAPDLYGTVKKAAQSGKEAAKETVK